MQGLIPAIVQDKKTGDVLMLAYMNEESFELTKKTKLAHFYSRSKNKIWKKGESSGNFQIVDEIYIDCDNDTILLKVSQNGNACHTGAKSCFFNRVDLDTSEIINICKDKKSVDYGILDELYHEILSRKIHLNPEISYTSELFKRGDNYILKKIAEECAEFLLSIKELQKYEKYADLNLEKFGEHIANNPKYDVIYEGSDLLFHIIVILTKYNIHPQNLLDELRRRRNISGIEEKKSRKNH